MDFSAIMKIFQRAKTTSFTHVFLQKCLIIIKVFLKSLAITGISVFFCIKHFFPKINKSAINYVFAHHAPTFARNKKNTALYKT